MNALQWLKENNFAYKNVEITDHCQENFVETDNKDEAMEETGVVHSDFLMPDIQVTNYLQEGTFPVRQSASHSASIPIARQSGMDQTSYKASMRTNTHYDTKYTVFTCA